MVVVVVVVIVLVVAMVVVVVAGMVVVVVVVVVGVVVPVTAAWTEGMSWTRTLAYILVYQKGSTVTPTGTCYRRTRAEVTTPSHYCIP